MNFLTRWVISLLCLFTFSLPYAQAVPFSDIVVFGDSLSDNGNTFVKSGGLVPPAPFYFQGRSSNGKVAVEYLADLTVAGGSTGAHFVDNAWAGATTGTVNTNDDGTFAPAGSLGLLGLQQQLAPYVTNPGLINGNTLYVVWAGPNDFLAGLAGASGFDPNAAIANAVTNLVNAVGFLAANGAEHILVPNMPDLGATPRAVLGGMAAQATRLTDTFNFFLNAAIQASLAPFLDRIVTFDSQTLLNDVITRPTAYGFQNISQPCLMVAACFADTGIQDTFLFWDDIHPTTRMHRIFGEQFARAVPEPASLTLVILGFGGLLLTRTREAVRHLH